MNRRAITIGVVAVGAAVAIGLWLRRSGAEEEEIVTDVAVHTAPISRATLHRYVTAYGYVEPAPVQDGQAAAGAVLSPLAPGVVAEIAAVEGRRVTKGAVLFRLDSRMADVAVRKAEREVEFAQKVADRQRQLLPTDGTSERAVQEAQQRLDDAKSGLAAARTARGYLEITAPLAGTVVGLAARVGQSVDPNTVLAKIVDLGRLVVSADVPAGEAAGLKVGQRVLLGADSTAPKGKLATVSPGVDPQTGTFRVQASIPAAAGFAPGQFTDIRILAEERPGVLVVPEVGVVTRAGAGSWIMVVEGDQAVRRPVSVGIREAGLVEVSGEGVEAGMIVVTVEAYSLPEKTKVHLVSR